MMIANQVGLDHIGIGSDENAVTVLWETEQHFFSQMPKQKLARELIALIASCYHKTK